jgi:hypothetical protein
VIFATVSLETSLCKDQRQSSTSLAFVSAHRNGAIRLCFLRSAFAVAIRRQARGSRFTWHPFAFMGGGENAEKLENGGIGCRHARANNFARQYARKRAPCILDKKVSLNVHVLFSFLIFEGLNTLIRVDPQKPRRLSCRYQEEATALKYPTDNNDDDPMERLFVWFGRLQMLITAQVLQY